VINGRLIPQSQVYDTDSQGRPHHSWITPVRQVVPDGHVFLLSTYHPRSWDSRYFGWVSASGIRGTAQPLWVWP
jgi:type IV secretory pathway protease TraF